MNIVCLALSFAVVTAGLCGEAKAESAHNAQTGARTSNAADTVPAAHWKQNPEWRTVPGTAKSATEPRVQLQNITTSSVLTADELERVQNEN